MLEVGLLKFLIVSAMVISCPPSAFKMGLNQISQIVFAFLKAGFSSSAVGGLGSLAQTAAAA
jgi:hypothetical protein